MANTENTSKDISWTTLTGQNKKLLSLTRFDERKRGFLSRNIFSSLLFKKNDKADNKPCSVPLPKSAALATLTFAQNLQVAKSPSLFTSNSAESSTGKTTPRSNNDSMYRRMVRVTGIPKGTLVATVLGFVRGGGLEKIEDLGTTSSAPRDANHRSNDPRPAKQHSNSQTVHLYFLTAEGASSFIAYANKCSILKLHGKHLYARWAHDKATAATKEIELDLQVAEEVKNNGASRVLILSHYMAGKTPISQALKLKYPHPIENFTGGFNCNAIKMDLSQFGQIVEVLPMISPKLSISFQFADIRSAILVMNTFNKPNSVLRGKYSLWKAKYARDVTNKPCYYP